MAETIAPRSDGWKSRKFWLAILFVILAFGFASFVTYVSYKETKEAPPLAGVATVCFAIAAGAFGYQYVNLAESKARIAAIAANGGASQ